MSTAVNNIGSKNVFACVVIGLKNFFNKLHIFNRGAVMKKAVVVAQYKLIIRAVGFVAISAMLSVGAIAEEENGSASEKALIIQVLKATEEISMSDINEAIMYLERKGGISEVAAEIRSERKKGHSDAEIGAGLAVLIALGMSGENIKAKQATDAAELVEKAAKLVAEATVPENKAAFDNAIRNAKIALGNNNYDAAIANITEAIRLMPEAMDDETYFIRGALYYEEKKDYDKAISDFTKAIQLNPNNGTAYSVRSDVWKKKKYYDKAIADLNEVIRIDPKDASAYNSRAWIYVYYLKKDYDRAIADATQAIKLEPKGGYYDTRGWAYLGKGDYNAAISDFSSALRFNSSITGSYLGRGKAYNETQEYKKAISDFNKVLRMSKDSDETKEANDGIKKAKDGLESIKHQKKKK